MTARSRLPRRPTDRLEDVAAWLLSVAIMLVAAAGVVVGLAIGAQVLDRDQAAASTRIRVEAVLQERVPVLAGEYGTGSAKTVARATWTAPDGHSRSGLVPAGPGTAAGAVVPIWTTADGSLLPAPAGPSTAAVLGLLAGLGVLAVGGCALAGGWAAVRHVLDGRRAAYWEREWDRVGPRWSGHLR